MDVLTLFFAVVALLFMLILLVFLYVWLGRTQTTETAEPETFESLCRVIYAHTATNKALNYAADTILNRFGTIQEYTVYEKLLKALCLHANTDSALVSRFEKILRDNNPKFKEKIQKTLKEGLSKRGSGER